MVRNLFALHTINEALRLIFADIVMIAFRVVEDWPKAAVYECRKLPIKLNHDL